MGNASFAVAAIAKGDGQLDLENVGFIIHQNNIGYFTSYGTPLPNEYVTYGTVSNSRTRISYHLAFVYGTVNLNTTFSLGFNNGKVVV